MSAPSDVRLEITGRTVTGRPAAGSARRPLLAWLFMVLPLALLAIVVVPVVWTFARAIGSLPESYDSARAGGALTAALGTLTWLVVATGILVAGFALAALGRRRRRLWRILRPALVIPFAVSSMVAGAAFRLMFDPEPARGAITHLIELVFGPGSSPVWLGPGWIRFVLVSTFVWTWLGFVTLLFREALTAIPHDLRRARRAEGTPWLRRFASVDLALSSPTIALVVITLFVATSRLFDLVLITSPAPVQGSVDVLALHWWRSTSSPGADSGPPALLASAMFVVIASIALLLGLWLRRRWTMPGPIETWADADIYGLGSDEPAPAATSAASVSHTPSGGGRVGRGTRRDQAAQERTGLVELAHEGLHRAGPARRLAETSIGVVLGVMWLAPVALLVATALRSPRAAGMNGIWTLDGWFGWRLGSIVDVVGSAELVRALGSTLAMALTAVAIVVVLGIGTAWLLAWGGRPRIARVATLVLAALAVVPVQTFAAPLREFLAGLGLAGNPFVLGFIHAAAGLPFAVLLLRVAFLSAPPSLISESWLGQIRQTAVLRRATMTYMPAVVTVAVLEFVLVWNDFVVTFLISGPTATPLTLLLWGEARQFSTAAGLVAAGSIASAVVPVVVMLATWRWVARGLTTGTRP